MNASFPANPKEESRDEEIRGWHNPNPCLYRRGSVRLLRRRFRPSGNSLGSYAVREETGAYGPEGKTAEGNAEDGSN